MEKENMNIQGQHVLGKPMYQWGDMVEFMNLEQVKTGEVAIIDSWGTFEQKEEPFYDIMVKEENCLYKHIRESWITRKLESAVPK